MKNKQHNKRIFVFLASILVEDLNDLALSFRRLQRTLRKVLVSRGLKVRRVRHVERK